MARRRTTYTAVAAGGALALAAVATGVLPDASRRPSAVASVGPVLVSDRLSPAAGCEALRRWYVRAALPQVGPWGLSGPPVLYAVPGSGPERTPAAAGTGTAPVGTSATGTNVQEPDVEESDLAKTDGRLLVRVVGRTLVVTDVRGDRPRELSRTTLPGGWLVDAELLLSGRRVLVVAAGDSSAMVPLRTPAGPQTNRGGGEARAHTRLLSYDLADPAAPRLTDDRTLDGSLVSARDYADGTVRLAVTTRLPRISLVRPGGGRTLAEATAENRRRVRAAPVDAWLPTVAAGGTRRRLADCATVRHPRQPSGFGTLSVVGFPLGRPDRAVSTSVVTGGDLVYSSARRLYVATVAAQRTTVHAFALDGSATSYVGSGTVPGVVAGRWSLSEQDGRLRVASTDEAPGGPASTVTVLAERGGALVPVGSLTGIGRGERLTAVRWLGDLAVLVTFRDTDPLWTVDLSTPSHPRLIGALRAPGYSSYLHPVGGDLLVGLGQVGSPSITGDAARAATFDVSDPRAVERVGSVGLGHGATVDAASDARTVSYLPQQRTLLVAVSSWSTGRSRFVALRVAPGGRLTTTGSWSVRGTGSELRALPLGGGRVVLVGEDAQVVHVR